MGTYLAWSPCHYYTSLSALSREPRTAYPRDMPQADFVRLRSGTLHQVKCEACFSSNHSDLFQHLLRCIRTPLRGGAPLRSRSYIYLSLDTPLGGLRVGRRGPHLFLSSRERTFSAILASCTMFYGLSLPLPTA